MNNKEEKILIIIPAYNEEHSISSVIDDAKRTLPFADILVINDASQDKTSLIAKKKGAVVLDMPFNIGIGGAMQTGFCYAKDFDYDIAAQFDADGQHNSKELPNMVNIINSTDMNKRVDMVIASRFLHSEGFKTSFLRRIGIRYFSFLIYLLTGERIADPTSGFRMINRGLIEFFAEHYAEDYPEPEAVVFALKEGFSVAEIPTYMRPRSTGTSSITPLKALYYMIKVSMSILILALVPNIGKQKTEYRKQKIE